MEAGTVPISTFPIALCSWPPSMAASNVPDVMKLLGIERGGGGQGEMKKRQKISLFFFKQVLRKLIGANDHRVV